MLAMEEDIEDNTIETMVARLNAITIEHGNNLHYIMKNAVNKNLLALRASVRAFSDSKQCLPTEWQRVLTIQQQEQQDPEKQLGNVLHHLRILDEAQDGVDRAISVAALQVVLDGYYDRFYQPYIQELTEARMRCVDRNIMQEIPRLLPDLNQHREFNKVIARAWYLERFCCNNKITIKGYLLKTFSAYAPDLEILLNDMTLEQLQALVQLANNACSGFSTALQNHIETNMQLKIKDFEILLSRHSNILPEELITKLRNASADMRAVFSGKEVNEALQHFLCDPRFITPLS